MLALADREVAVTTEGWSELLTIANQYREHCRTAPQVACGRRNDTVPRFPALWACRKTAKLPSVVLEFTRPSLPQLRSPMVATVPIHRD
jgi:hypothetical protein